MIQSIRGRLVYKGDHVLVVEVGGVGFRVVAPVALVTQSEVGEEVRLSTYFHIRENILELYGFPDEDMREFFEMLISVNGVGPKSGLAILDVADLHELKAAIQEGRPDLLTKASGVGRKSAERIVLELRGKVVAIGTEKLVTAMDSDSDLVETLVSLGYKKDQVRAALQKVDRSVTDMKERLKFALGVLSGKK
jgi:holliday junction DNA helicase RuvA